MIPTAAEELDLARAGWRRMPLAAEIVFFVLTAIAVLALFALCHLWDLPEGWATGIVAIGAAEWLIRRYRFWRTGVESALWIGGLVAFIAALPRSGAPEAALVFAAAAALAGWRLRNGVAGAASVVLVIAYPGLREWAVLAVLGGVLIGFAAAVAATHVWRRPSTGLLFGVIAVTAPVAGFLARQDWVAWRTGPSAPSAPIVIVSLAALAALDLAVGAHYRVRAPLIAGVIALGLAGVEASRFMPTPVEANLIAAGLAMLAAASLLLRALRGRTTGIVSATVEKPELAEAAQTVSMLGMATAPGHRGPEPGHEPPPDRGGRFGGGGASDRY